MAEQNAMAPTTMNIKCRHEVSLKTNRLHLFRVM